MAFAFDEAWIYGGQLSSSRRNVVPEGLGKGDDKVTHSLYIQGPSQFGTNTSYSGNKGGVEATVKTRLQELVTAIAFNVKAGGNNKVHDYGTALIGGTAILSLIHI